MTHESDLKRMVLARTERNWERGLAVAAVIGILLAAMTWAR